MIGNQPAFLRSEAKTAAAADAQFIQYMTDMGLHCRKLDIHDFTDLRIALIRTDQPENLQFRSCQ